MNRLVIWIGAILWRMSKMLKKLRQMYQRWFTKNFSQRFFMCGILYFFIGIMPIFIFFMFTWILSNFKTYQSILHLFTLSVFYGLLGLIIAFVHSLKPKSKLIIGIVIIFLLFSLVQLIKYLFMIVVIMSFGNATSF